MLAEIVSGKVDLADALFLLAVILFGIVAILKVLARDVEGILMAAAFTLLALAWLVL